MYVTIDKNNLTLHILDVNINEAGRYSCQVKNDAGTVVEHVYLRVKRESVVHFFFFSPLGT